MSFDSNETTEDTEDVRETGMIDVRIESPWLALLNDPVSEPFDNVDDCDCTARGLVVAMGGGESVNLWARYVILRLSESPGPSLANLSRIYAILLQVSLAN